MKHLATILTLIIFFSCTASKKSTRERRETVDSASVKKEYFGAVSKTDSSADKKKEIELSKKSDSGYSKRTVVREFYSDEFDFDGPDTLRPVKNQIPEKPGDQRPRSAAGTSKAGRLLYRETETIETGQLSKSESEKIKETAETELKKVDSGAVAKSDSSVFGQKSTESYKDSKKTTFLPWWALLIIGALAVLLIYKIAKRWL